MIRKIRKKIIALNKKAISYTDMARKVSTTCTKIGKSWSGSSLVGHAKYFFTDFEEPSTQERFSIEWGLINGVPRGWIERSDEEIRTKIESDSGASLDHIRNLATELEKSFIDIQREAVLILSENGLSELEIGKIEKFTMKSTTDIFNDIFPTKFYTRDSNAMTGHYIAPHIYYDAVAQFVFGFPDELKSFSFELEKVASKKAPQKSTDDTNIHKLFYIENSVILKLSELKSKEYDQTRLIKMCKELNDNYSLENFLSCGLLIRAILDHVPPIFGKKSFTEVANNHGTKSFKDIILPLEITARKISDSYLHSTIQKKEIIPNKTQISFQPNMDVLLNEIIRILNSFDKDN